MGAFLVPAWLDAHARQVPAAVLQRRRREWTPDVSAAAWGRTLDEIDVTPGHPSTVLVAEDTAASGAHGALIGLGMITVIGNGTAEIDALYVAGDRHGGGLGRRLLAELTAIARSDGVTSIETDVLAANAPARAFYDRLGGRVVGHGVVDDDGIELPAVRYAWHVDALVGAAR